MLFANELRLDQFSIALYQLTAHVYGSLMKVENI